MPYLKLGRSSGLNLPESQLIYDESGFAGLYIIFLDSTACVGRGTPADWGIRGKSCSNGTNKRGLNVIEIATASKIANTLGIHKPSRTWMWYSLDGN